MSQASRLEARVNSPLKEGNFSGLVGLIHALLPGHHRESKKVIDTSPITTLDYLTSVFNRLNLEWTDLQIIIDSVPPSAFETCWLEAMNRRVDSSAVCGNFVGSGLTIEQIEKKIDGFGNESIGRLKNYGKATYDEVIAFLKGEHVSYLAVSTADSLTKDLAEKLAAFRGVGAETFRSENADALKKELQERTGRGGEEFSYVPQYKPLATEVIDGREYIRELGVVMNPPFLSSDAAEALKAVTPLIYRTDCSTYLGRTNNLTNPYGFVSRLIEVGGNPLIRGLANQLAVQQQLQARRTVSDTNSFKYNPLSGLFDPLDARRIQQDAIRSMKYRRDVPHSFGRH